jgi:hypothetical protein
MMMVAGLLLVAVHAVAAPDALPTAPRSGPVSWDQANSLTRKLEAIEKRRMEKSRKRETVLFTQGELNSYLNLTYAEKLPKGLRDVEVKLDRDRILAKGLVNIDRVKGKVGEGGGSWGPLSFLSGDVPVEITGKLTAKDGFGQVVWETVYLSSMRVPTSVLEQLVLSATKTEENPEGFDITAPFRLPYSVNRLRLEPGRALLDF